MKRIYLDTEFNGHGGELISMALVSGSDGRAWYGVRRAAIVRLPCVWVRENVIPVLKTTDYLDDEHFRKSLHAFLLDYENPEIICDWHADVTHLCEWMEGPDYASSVDYPCRITVLKTPIGQPVSRIPHNAVSDAEALMHWYEERLAASLS